MLSCGTRNNLNGIEKNNLWIEVGWLVVGFKGDSLTGDQGFNGWMDGDDDDNGDNHWEKILDKI